MISAANKGIHWEYRVFGVLLDEHRARLESFCQTSVLAGSVRDRYIWSPGCAANIKIRRKKLKLKHLLEAAPDGFELWDEGKHLKFKFPLDLPRSNCWKKSCALHPRMS